MIKELLPDEAQDSLWHVYAGDDDAADRCLEELTGPQLRKMAASIGQLHDILRHHQLRRAGKDYHGKSFQKPRLAR